ncbi:hypothetical protein EAT49_13305 [Histidinibacterium lentulum]|uniref:Uncharacterized protein n=2 Tax=Histidinibacterium lentulum TaxID=2480588 RepID=A0A3N2QYN4_9RHOB|nr:hypothetical protein EAT49_13305 [Histidinibacterium lentulum]
MMLEFYTPLIVAMALGIEPGGGEDRPTLPSPAEALPTFAPEPQVPTGRFTTAVEVKPILAATRGSWVAVREWEGQDWVYFTHLLSWRCGLHEIRFGLNGAPPEEILEMEPCHEETMQPNALISDLPIWRTYPPGSVQSITMEVTFDDNTTERHEVTRAEILLP